MLDLNVSPMRPVREVGVPRGREDARLDFVFRPFSRTGEFELEDAFVLLSAMSFFLPLPYLLPSPSPIPSRLSSTSPLLSISLGTELR